jgi:purine-nucleoside phosphorylase
MTVPLQPTVDLMKRLLNGFVPRVLIVGGSGGHEIVKSVLHPEHQQISFADVGTFPIPSVEGHQPIMCYGTDPYLKTKIAATLGRVHYYEGYTPDECVFLIRVMILLGVEIVILTSAVGSCDPELKPGEVALVTDHLNLTDVNAFRGPHVPEYGSPYPDQSSVYSYELHSCALDAIAELKLTPHLVKTAFMAGRPYETPIEAKALGMLGCQTAGMSMPIEATAASAMGAKVLGLQVVTNFSGTKGDHHEVLRAVELAGENLQKILSGVITRLETL